MGRNQNGRVRHYYPCSAVDSDRPQDSEHPECWGHPARSPMPATPPRGAVPDNVWSQTGPNANGRTLSRVGVAGDPGVDLGPGSFQPSAQLIGLGKFGGWEQSRADEQLPVDRQLPPGPCPPVRAKAVVGEHKDIGARCSGHRSGDTSGVRGQRIGLSQCTARSANPAGRAEFGNRGAPPRQGEVRPFGEQEKRLSAGQRRGQIVNLVTGVAASGQEAQAPQLPRKVENWLAAQDGPEYDPDLQPILDREQPGHQQAIPRTAMP